MTFITEHLGLLLLLGSAVVVILGALLAHTGLRLRWWHGTLGLVGSFSAFTALSDSELPPDVAFVGMGVALLGAAASAAALYASRRQSYINGAAASVTPRRSSHSDPVFGWFLSRKVSWWRLDVQYAVVVAGRRLVAARVGGQHSAAQSPWQGGALGLLLGAEIRDVELRRNAAIERALGAGEVDLDALVAHHRANFQLEFSQLARARLVPRSLSAQWLWRGPATLVLEPHDAPEVRLLLETSAEVHRCEAALRASPLAFEMDAALLATSEKTVA